MDFLDLIQACKAQALKDVLVPTEESVYKSVCRAYSQKFHVPLPDVFKMDPEHVLLMEFTSQLEEINLDKQIGTILEQIYTLENPNYEETKEEDLKEFIAKAEAEEKARLKKLKKTPKKKPAVLEKKPLGGSVDFSNLQDEEKPGKF